MVNYLSQIITQMFETLWVGATRVISYSQIPVGSKSLRKFKGAFLHMAIVNGVVRRVLQ